jgi:hypothetical protein
VRRLRVVLRRGVHGVLRHCLLLRQRVLQLMQRLGLVLAGAAVLAAPAAAHEPLWGETPSVFGFGVLHPEVKSIFFDAGSTRNGGERMRMSELETMLDYAPSAAINLRIEIPYHNNLHEEQVGGVKRSAVISGLGDITLRAKRRFSVRQDVGLNVQHSLLFGIKLPTGESDHRAPDGERADPHDQTGTGRPGILLGYAFDRERIDDTIWASVVWTRDLGGGFRMGDMLVLDLAYGPWLRRPNEARELGFNLALGLHGEYHADDPLGGGRDAGNGHRLVGFQVTPILTKGNHQLRFGVFVPFVRGGSQEHTDFPYEVRAAFETFF